ncbi:unnamed protein product [Paramecium sonneborni]|uniref:Uncharacterized protein n=1 Tax=Paramecium sonneborni TaxID=65129 RepID=A0A8S1L123_9CILI|nr:unnamed protein product [Paramecium sonneborni]
MNYVSKKPLKARKIVCQYYPPALGLVYKRPDNKTKMYKIQFNEMVQINDAEKITSFLFDQHSLHFNEQNVPYDQILEIVQLILSNQKLMKSSSLSFKKKQSPFTYDQGFSDEEIDLI